MLAEPEGIAKSMLRKLGTSPAAVAQEVMLAIGNIPKVSGTTETYLSPRAKAVLDAAFAEASKMKDQYVSVEHILIAIADEKRGEAARILKRYGIGRESILKVLMDIRGGQTITDPTPEEKIPGPGQVQPGPDPSGAAGQARSGDRAGTTRSDGSSRSFHEGPKTIRCSSATPVSERRLLWRAWPSASFRETYRKR